MYPIQHDSTNYQQVGEWARKALSFDAASVWFDQNIPNKNDENELCGQKSNMEDTLNYYFIDRFSHSIPNVAQQKASERTK